MRLLILGLALILASGALAGCKPKPPPNRLIAFLLASDQSSRWMDSDEPAFQKRVNQTCKGCSYLTLNASGDPDLQSEQFDQALSQGADVIVLNAVDSERAEDLIVAAGKVPVIAYDRFVAGADYYVSYDAQVTGELQAEAVLADAGGAAPSVLLIDGGRLDANTRSIKDARAATFGKKVQVLAELEPATWSAEEAAAWIKTQLGKHRPTTVDAIVAANDTQAGAVVDVLTSMGVKPRQFPYITGQDASLEAVRRIVQETGDDGLQAHHHRGQPGSRSGRRAGDQHRGDRLDGLRGRRVLHLHPAVGDREQPCRHRGARPALRASSKSVTPPPCRPASA